MMTADDKLRMIVVTQILKKRFPALQIDESIAVAIDIIVAVMGIKDGTVKEEWLKKEEG